MSARAGRAPAAREAAVAVRATRDARCGSERNRARPPGPGWSSRDRRRRCSAGRRRAAPCHRRRGADRTLTEDVPGRELADTHSEARVRGHFQPLPWPVLAHFAFREAWTGPGRGDEVTAP